MTLSVGVTDDQFGAYVKKTMAIADRLGKSLPYTRVMDALQRIHDGQFDGVVRTIPIWKTIQIGGKTKDQLIAELKTSGCEISSWAQDIMSKPEFTTAKKVRTINLARCTVSDLGFTDPNNLPTTVEIWARIKELGHTLCPAEVGPHLRLQYGDQQNGDYVWVAMEQIADSGGSPNVFNVRRYGSGDRWLYTCWPHPGGRWHLDNGVVFVRRK